MTYITRRTVAALMASALLGAAAAAQTVDHGDMDHAAHAGSTTEATTAAAPSSTVPSEPGQGAFAAISEVVQTLEADPATDWSAVDLTALRDHLVDMDRLVSDAVVDETVLPDGLRAVVTGDAPTLTTVRRMVPAHAAELARDDRWRVEVRDEGTNVTLTVASGDASTVARIQGLGFFGLMASQDHHREHHMMIALGGSHGR